MNFPEKNSPAARRKSGRRGIFIFSFSSTPIFLYINPQSIILQYVARFVGNFFQQNKFLFPQFQDSIATFQKNEGDFTPSSPDTELSLFFPL